MTAAYAALVSLMHLLEEVQRYATRRSVSISLDKKKQMASLHEKVCFLIDFLESDYASGLEQMASLYLETRIADSVYAAQDIIDNHMLNAVTASKTNKTVTLSFPDIQKVMEEMDSIKERVMKIKNVTGIKNKKDMQLSNPIIAKYSSSYHIPFRMDAMVGREEELIRIMDRITGSNTNRQIISITGMGGIGKTTLAKNVYEDPFIVSYFDIRVWVSIAQGYGSRQILLGALLCQENPGMYKDLATFPKEMNQMDEMQLGDILFKSLYRKRYLVVLDDLLSTEAWDTIKFYFPDRHNRSRIIVTTRISSIATYVDSYTLMMRFLDEDESWNLLCRKVFALEGCPLELEEVGRKIVKNCNGLPLMIVAIGGVLLGSTRTKEHWECVARETNSRLNAESQDHCINILALSYHHLPVHLKPCFLYMGIFPEDNEIRTALLIDLWVGEGFLKPNSSKYLEEVGEEYLNDLISRNLISVHKRGSDGKPKSCKIHSLLRDLCLREAHKDKFFYVANVDSPDTIQEDISSQYRISLHQCSSKGESLLRGLKTMKLGSRARSLICDLDGVLPLKKFRLLKVLKVADKYTNARDGTENKYLIDDVFQLINSRYIAFRAVGDSAYPSSLGLLWNLQILIVDEVCFDAPLEIWEMTELRHLEFRSGLYLPDPPSKKMDMQDDAVLTNLRTLTRVENFRCSDEVLKRIPNIKKLDILYENVTGGFENYYLQNLRLLEKLESVSCNFYAPLFKPQNWTKPLLAFPNSLKKLTLVGCEFEWEDMTNIGSLPHLEVLKLKTRSFRGFKWIPVEGDFYSLKFLLIDNCDLVHWDAKNTHFPVLEHLVLRSLHELEEIPSSIGEIPTLKSIRLDYCSNSAVISAKEILEEQQCLGNYDLQVRVNIRQEHELESLASHNFHVQNAQVEDESASPGEIHVVEPEMSIENLSPVKQQKGEDSYYSDQPRGSRNLGQSNQTPTSAYSDALEEESITITIPAIGYLQYVDLELKIIHASLQQMQDLVIDQVNGVLPPECLIYKGVSGSTELPTEEEWERACIVCLTEMNQLVSLPQKPYCPNLVFLFLPSKSYFFHIPPSFFDLMPVLRFVDLSGIRSSTLPNSLFNCTQLQVLLLRNCVYLDDLPTEIEKLCRIEVLDLSGTELCNLSDQVGKLVCLKDLQLSLYGPDDESEYIHLPPQVLSKNTLSKLQAMQALSISVHPEDYRWRKIAGDITQEIAMLKNLRHLQFYFPEIKNFQDFIQLSPSWANGLKTFKFVVGRDVKRIAPRVPDGVESKYHQLEKCLRFVNGDGGIPLEIKEVLARAEAFCLDHHFQVRSLSQFGISNLRKLKFCVVKECSGVKAIIDEEAIVRAVLPSVEFMGIHYLWNLQYIWNPVHMPPGSFRALKHLEVYTCRELKFIFPVSMLSYFSNLEELVVEDCEAVTKITEGEMETVKFNVTMFPQLRKVELRYLPRLVSLGPGLCLTEEQISVYGCPNLHLKVNLRKLRGSLRGCCF